jgi:hypothetical protein
METTTKRTNYGVQYGLIAGLGMIVIILVQYLGGLEYFMHPLGFLLYAALIAVAVVAGLKQRKDNGGFLSFAEALKVTFTVFAIALLLQTLFSYVLLNIIDIPFKQAVGQETLNRTEQFMKKMGAPQRDIERALDEAAKGDPFSLPKMFLGYAMTCIVFFIVALIIAAIIKRNKPAFANT